MIKRYANTQNGQVHVRTWQAEGASAPPLVCLHAIPYSGLHFAVLAPLLLRGRTVICPDYPGYGASDAPAGEASVEAYAATLLDALGHLGFSGPLDLLGFHTGCLVGPEMALQAPERVRRLVLIDVPFYGPEQRQELLPSESLPPSYSADLDSLQPAWQRNVASKLGRQEMDRCLALLAEQLRTGQQAHAGFAAAYSYASDEFLPRVQQPCLVIATGSSLAEPSREAAQVLPKGTLLELPELGPPVLDTGAEPLAAACRAFLDGPEPAAETR